MTIFIWRDFFLWSIHHVSQFLHQNARCVSGFDAIWRALTHFDGFEGFWTVLRHLDRLMSNHLTFFSQFFRSGQMPSILAQKCSTCIAFSDRCCQGDNGYHYFFDISSFDDFFNSFEFSEFSRSGQMPSILAQKCPTCIAFSDHCCQEDNGYRLFEEFIEANLHYCVWDQSSSDALYSLR